MTFCLSKSALASLIVSVGLVAGGAGVSSTRCFAANVMVASKLGDLSPFRIIAVDVMKAIDRGDLVAAKARAKDLEADWDAAEAGLKPRAAADWHIVDKAIDSVLIEVRAQMPNAAAAKKTTADLLSIIDRMSGKM
jgi:hypothetical protein